MKNILKLFILFMFCLTSSALAKDVLIPSVTVTENNQNYSIILNTTENVKYKKVLDGSDKIYFEITNINSKKDIPINYKNIETIEGVSIQKISSNKIRIYVQGDKVENARLYITDVAGNPFYIDENKFNGINGKNIALLIAGILFFSMFMSSDKKEELQVARATYDNNIMLQNLRQNKIVRINDFLNKENASNPIQHGGNRVSDPDLEMIRKSA